MEARSTITLTISSALLVALGMGCSSSTNNVRLENLAKAEVSEVIIFASPDGFEDSEVVDRADSIGEVLYAQDGFLSRFFSRSEDTWLIVNFWTDGTSIDSGNAIAIDTPEADSMFEVIDPNGMVFERLDLSSRPDDIEIIENAGIIEVVRLASKEDVSQSEFVALAETMGQVLYQQDGFLARYIMTGDGRNWIFLNLWTNADAVAAGNQVAGASPEAQDMFNAIADVNAVTVTPFTIRSRP